jgi:rhodanese-related sulfurtransferase
MLKYIRLLSLVSIIIAVIYLLYIYYDSINIPSASPLKISIPEARAKRFGLIIDVRTPQERNRLGYYPNSIPISLDNLSKEVPLDISSKNTSILVYSNGDDRARLGAELLYKMGYRRVNYIDKPYLSLMPGSR